MLTPNEVELEFTDRDLVHLFRQKEAEIRNQEKEIAEERRRFKDRLLGKGLSKGKAQRKPISDEVKMFVWKRDGGCCVKCGSQELLEFDHIIPVSKGGSDTERNLQLLCETCNRKKSARI